MNGLQPIAVITQQGSTLRAIALAADDGRYEILWAKQARLSETDWARFAAECGVSAPAPREPDDRKLIAGFDSSSVVFTRLEVPPVKDEDLAAMVTLQAESRLPLPADKMQLAWRVCCQNAGNAVVTVGAARTETLAKFVDAVRPVRPSAILLNAEGAVRAWLQCFGGSPAPTVVISIEAWNTCVCLAEDGRLSNAVSLDIGAEDFIQAEDAGRKAELTERFMQDTARVLDLFASPGTRGAQVHVLSDESPAITQIVSALVAANINAVAAPIRTAGAELKTSLTADQLYTYRTAIGLALLALDEQRQTLNLFDRLYTSARKEDKPLGLLSLKKAAAVAAAALILLIVVSYAMDIVTLRAIEKSFNAQSGEITFSQIEKRRQLVTEVARQRQQTDVLKLFTRVNSVDAAGVLLNSIEYKRDKPVKIVGETPQADQLYKFQEELIKVQGVSNVTIQSAPEDARTKKLRFTMTFDYKSTGRNEPVQQTKPQPQSPTEQKEKQ